MRSILRFAGGRFGSAASLLILLAALLAGCVHREDAVALPGLEGTYVRSDNPSLTLTLTNGHYRQGSAAIAAQGHYHAHKLDAQTYELHVHLEGALEGSETSIRIRKEGDALRVTDLDNGEETLFHPAQKPAN